MRRIKGQTIILLCFLLAGCTVYPVRGFRFPQEDDSSPYCHEHPEEEAPILLDQWWDSFALPALSEVVEEGIEANYDLKAAWCRLSFAEAEYRHKYSHFWPTLNGVFEGETKELFEFVGLGNASSCNNKRFFAGTNLSYEVDLWKKIDSNVEAAKYVYCATEEEVQSTELVLAGKIIDSWFTIQEQKLLLQIVNKQVAVNETLFELAKTRFAIGQANALDVYQQQLQLAETATQIPLIKSALETAGDYLQVLLAETPSDRFLCEEPVPFGDLPPFPLLGKPIDLMQTRPDLRAKRNRLIAADYEVAVAVADCFPRLTLSGIYETRANDFDDLFKKQILGILGNIFMPILDGGRRQAEADKKRAVVCEKWMLLAQQYLNAVSEVEDCLVKEKYQKELLEQLQEEIILAQLNLEEAQLRYMNGLNDYLPVIAAIQAYQRIERRIVIEKKSLFQNRSRLYRALGGVSLCSM